MKIRLVRFKGCLYVQAIIDKAEKKLFLLQTQGYTVATYFSWFSHHVANQTASCMVNESHAQTLAL